MKLTKKVHRGGPDRGVSGHVPCASAGGGGRASPTGITAGLATITTTAGTMSAALSGAGSRSAR